jgi:hypothetical protein
MTRLQMWVIIFILCTAFWYAVIIAVLAYVQA